MTLDLPLIEQIKNLFAGEKPVILHNTVPATVQV